MLFPVSDFIESNAANINLSNHQNLLPQYLSKLSKNQFLFDFFNSVNVTYYRRLDVNRYLVISRNPLQLPLQPARKGSDRFPFCYQAKLFRLEQNISKGIVDLTETYFLNFLCTRFFFLAWINHTE